jgi:methyl-accepting chemotaxis protein
MWLLTSSIRRQLIASFAIVSVLYLVALAIGFSSVSSVNSTVQSAAKDDAVLQQATGHARDMMFSEVRTLLDKQAFADAATDLATFRATIAQLRHYATSPAARHAMSALDKAFAQWLVLHERVLGLARAGHVQQGTELAQGPANDAADHLGEAVANVSAAISKANTGAAKSTSDHAQTLMLILALIAVLAAGAIALLISRDLAGRIKRLLSGIRSLDSHCMAGLRAGLEAIAGGDLTRGVEPQTTQIPTTRRDELGELTSTFNGMVEKTQSSVEAYNTTRGKVASMLHEIGRTSDQLSAASQEMARTSEDTGRAVDEIAHAVTSVAEGAEDQVRSIAEAKALTEDVATASEASAGGARDTAGAAAEARSLARDGAEAVAQATTAIRAVQASSDETTAAIRALGAKNQQIGGIVDTITGIAEQTNLLALNAAIEAARVGEQGRGFAVVAEEVRKLAEESQAAASSIAELIDQIQKETDRAVDVVEQGSKQTEDGVVTVERAHEAFERISASVDDMSARVDQIADAIQQIASAGRSMQDSITSVAAVAEQSSASSQQVSASTVQTGRAAELITSSASDLAKTAVELEQLVGRFTLS